MQRPWELLLTLGLAGSLLLFPSQARPTARGQSRPASPVPQNSYDASAPILAAAGSTGVAAGERHTCAAISGGGVRCWGANGFGQLGDGTTTQQLTPTVVSTLTNTVAALAAGGNHTCAISSAGGAKCWGDNGGGQLGDGTTTQRLTPVDVFGLMSGVQAISAGASHTCAIVGGGAKCWGWNHYGQLGTGMTTTQLTPVDVSGLASGVTAIAASLNHTCALTTGGGVKCWGWNDSGQLGNGLTATQYSPVDVIGLSSGVQAIAAGWAHTCALTTGGAVKCWGWNDFGQLGDGTLESRLAPTDVSGLSSGVEAITAGAEHTCALANGTSAMCWGSNLYGQVGDGTTAQRLTPVQVLGMAVDVTSLAAGGGHTCAVTVGRGVKCWGWNGGGQLGIGQGTAELTQVEVLGLGSAAAISAGWTHSCALTVGGGGACWGWNVHGQLGDGTRTNRQMPVVVSGLANDLVALAPDALHTCALTISGGVKCWGYNGSGQLGNGLTDTQLVPVDVTGLITGVTAIAAGYAHTCALTSGGGVKCWGDNSSGQLGNGLTGTQLVPVDVTGLITGVTAIAAGYAHTCALTSGGGVKCWGSNVSGQLGDGTTTSRLTPTDVQGLASGAAAIAAGNSHTCAVTIAGGAKCWGFNGSGQLGDGTMAVQQLAPVDVSGLTSGVEAVAAGGSHTCAITGGGLKCWGSNNAGQLGDGSFASRNTPADVTGLTSGAASVALGEFHTCALTVTGVAKCWGHRGYGQLGNNTRIYRDVPIDVTGLLGVTFQFLPIIFR